MGRKSTNVQELTEPTVTPTEPMPPPTEPKRLEGEATEEQIAAWKKEHPKGIVAIIAGDHIGYFKYPSRRDLNYCMSQQDADNPLYYYELLMQQMQIGGSKELLTDDALFFACVPEIRQMTSFAAAVVVKL